MFPGSFLGLGEGKEAPTSGRQPTRLRRGLQRHIQSAAGGPGMGAGASFFV